MGFYEIYIWRTGCLMSCIDALWALFAYWMDSVLPIPDNTRKLKNIARYTVKQCNYVCVWAFKPFVFRFIKIVIRSKFFTIVSCKVKSTVFDISFMSASSVLLSGWIGVIFSVFYIKAFHYPHTIPSLCYDRSGAALHHIRCKLYYKILRPFSNPKVWNIIGSIFNNKKTF